MEHLNIYANIKIKSNQTIFPKNRTLKRSSEIVQVAGFTDCCTEAFEGIINPIASTVFISLFTHTGILE